MKKIFAAFAILLLWAAQASPSEYAEGEVLVVLEESVESLDVRADGLARRHRAKASATFPEIAATSGRNIVHLRSETKSTKELIEELKNNPEVESVQPNYIMRVMAIPKDTHYAQQWGMTKIGMESVWDTRVGSTDVVVAIMDTGVNYNHEDIKDNMSKDSYGNFGRHFYKNGTIDGDPMDIDGHGTHVAGTIGAVGSNDIGVTGVNWRVGLLAVNVFTKTGGEVLSYTSDQIRAISYILGQKNGGMNIRVVNMSFGAWLEDAGEAYGNAVKSMSDAGIIVVFAAGNESQNIDSPSSAHNGTIVFPASYRFTNSITVGATDKNDGKMSYSNYAPKYVHIAAPGDGIYSTVKDAPFYGSMSGTSMSAPFVAGAAALLCAAHPNDTATQIKARLLNGAANFGRSYWEYGRLDVYKALSASPDGTYSNEPFPVGSSSTNENQGTGSGGGCSTFGAFAVILLLIPISLRSSRV